MPVGPISHLPGGISPRASTMSTGSKTPRKFTSRPIPITRIDILSPFYGTRSSRLSVHVRLICADGKLTMNRVRSFESSTRLSTNFFLKSTRNATSTPNLFDRKSMTSILGCTTYTTMVCTRYILPQIVS